jgi:hypothetical protein
MAEQDRLDRVRRLAENGSAEQPVLLKPRKRQRLGARSTQLTPSIELSTSQVPAIVAPVATIASTAGMHSIPSATSVMSVRPAGPSGAVPPLVTAHSVVTTPSLVKQAQTIGKEVPSGISNNGTEVRNVSPMV